MRIELYGQLYNLLKFEEGIIFMDYKGFLCVELV